MPRKFFQKYLPSHETIRNNRYIARFGTFFLHPNLWHINRRSVAGGVAAGMFAGLVPGSNPVQFAVAALLAVAFRVNLPVAVAVTLYTNPFTIGPIYLIAYWIGTLLVPGDSALREQIRDSWSRLAFFITTGLYSSAPCTDQLLSCSHSCWWLAQHKSSQALWMRQQHRSVI